MNEIVDLELTSKTVQTESITEEKSLAIEVVKTDRTNIISVPTFQFDLTGYQTGTNYFNTNDFTNQSEFLPKFEFEF